MRVDGWLARAAARRPDACALVTDEGSLTYTELDAAATIAAGRLAAAGAAPGTHVGLALPPGRAFAEAFWGVLRLGAVAVPVDPRVPRADRERRLAGCAVVVDAPLAGPPAPFPADAGHDLGAVAVVVHTSGSTGEPRPVGLTYGNWLWSALGSATALGHPPGERWLCTLPLAHVGGLSILVRSAIGATTAIVRPRFDAAAVAAELAAPGGPTMVSLVPTTLTRLLDAGLRDPPALRWALLGGAPIAPALLERARAAGIPVAPTYGLTEACSQVTTFGRPLFCTRVRLGPDGEVLVSGPTVAPGPGPELATGDQGVLGPDGALAITGRLADTIITGGENVAPAEVEAVLEAHPGVAQAAVLGRPDPEWGEAVVALIVAAGERAPDDAALRAWCAERLAPFQVPKAFHPVTDLPRTASGKLHRAGLRVPGA